MNTEDQIENTYIEELIEELMKALKLDWEQAALIAHALIPLAIKRMKGRKKNEKL